VSRTAAARLRRLWLNVHLWLGVGLLVALIPLGLSGSVLVWHGAVDRALYSDRYEVTGPVAQAPSAYLDAARAAFEGRATATSLRLPDKAGDPVTVVGRMAGPPAANGRPRQLTAWIDPATARVLDTGEINQSVTGVLHRVHGSLLIPGQGVGRKVVGWLGWAMTASCLTGLWLWWPRSGSPVKGLRWTRSASTLTNLHHTFGFWILVPLLVVSLTGVYISFPKTSHALFGAPPPQQRPMGRAMPAPVKDPQLSADEALTIAVQSRPRAGLSSMTLPTEGRKSVWKVELTDGDPIEVDDRTGQVQAARPERAGPGPDKLSRLMRNVHDGGDTPLVWQVLVFLTGLAPALLGITGTIMWLRRRGRREVLS
jgi:uncharacterized iron-regulated membrane protein